MEKKILEEKRKAAIARRREGISVLYRATYDRAVSGKSLRAAVNAQCLECVCWQRIEITNCTDLACPLYAYRPYRISAAGRNEPAERAESTSQPVPLSG
jgi:hypothetical protein